MRFFQLARAFPMLRQALATKSATKRQVVSVAIVSFFVGTDDALRRRYTDDVTEIAILVRRAAPCVRRPRTADRTPPTPPSAHSC